MTDRKYLYLLPILVALLGALLVVPSFAQETSTQTDNGIIVVGPVDFSEKGELLVAGYIIAPSGAVIPSALYEGDAVIVVGSLLDDGLTIRAERVAFFVEPEGTPGPAVTPNATAGPIDEEDDSDTDCVRDDHPVARNIAREFDVDDETIIALHCDGYGFGDIARAYLLAEQTDLSAQDYLDRYTAGESWGEIIRDADVDPSSLAPGRVIGGPPGDTDDDDNDGRQGPPDERDDGDDRVGPPGNPNAPGRGPEQVPPGHQNRGEDD